MQPSTSRSTIAKHGKHDQLLGARHPAFLSMLSVPSGTPLPRLAASKISVRHSRNPSIRSPSVSNTYPTASAGHDSSALHQARSFSSRPALHEPTTTRMSPLFARLRTPVYKNTGSVARDHLASERTFLAWLRTGLGFVALGIAIERFSQLDLTELLVVARPPAQGEKHSGADKHGGSSFKETSNVLVGALLGTGTGSIAYGTSRYFENMRLLERGLFKPAYYGAGALGIAVAGLAGGVYWSAVREKNGRGEGDSGR